jgi:nucleoside 2-deoxyribosyltransferase
MSRGRVYWAAPLFNESERRYNAECVEYLESCGYEVFLPQREVGSDGAIADIVEKDLQGVHDSDYVIAVLNGPCPDAGTVFEMGYALALGKKVYAIHDDRRFYFNYMFYPVEIRKDIGEVEKHIRGV